MHKFIYSITLTNGIVGSAGFAEIQDADLPLVSGAIAGDYSNPSLHVDQYGRITSIVSGTGGGGGTGTVTSISIVSANGVSGSVANPTTTPAITLTLGAITPSSIVVTNNFTMLNGLFATSKSTSVTNTSQLVCQHELKCSGTPAVGFGAVWDFLLADNTGTSIQSGLMLIKWVDATSPHVKSQWSFSVISGVFSQEFLRGEGSVSGAKIGFLGSSAVVQQTGDIGTALVAFGLMSSPTYPSLDAIPVPVADVSLNSHKLTNVLDPTAAQDAATKNYVDLAVAALDEHAAVKYATAAALTESSYTNNGGVGDVLTLVAGVVLIDGQAMTVGDRVLIKNQAAPAHNGIWTVTTVGLLAVSAVFTRATDFDQESDGIAGAMVFVLNGTVNDDTRWQCSAAGGITWGTTAINWSQFTGATYTADETTLHLTGTTFSIKSTYVGQASITTLGTVTTGVWNGTRVTLANIATAGANSILLGSGTAGSGASYAELTLGTGLTMTGTTLSATSSGSGGGPDPKTSIYPAFTPAGVDDEFDDGSFTGWTLVDDGTHTPTVTETNNVCSILLPGGDTVAHLHAYLKTTTVNANDIIEMAFRGYGQNTNTNMCGLIFTDGTTYGAGSQVVWSLVPQPDAGIDHLSISNFNTNNAGGVTITTAGANAFTDCFIRLKYLGSNNWVGYASPDGISWCNMTGTFSRTLTPTAVGFFVSSWGSANPFAWSIRYFRKTT